MPETFTNSAGFELLPAGDEDLIDADAQLLAAEASLTDDPFQDPAAQPPPIPFGRSWAWDRERQRYRRIGAAPAEIRGIDSLREWILNALATAQGAHACFSAEFGIEDPDDWIGLTDPTDAIATFEPRAREALLVHDRLEELDDMTPAFDPQTGTIYVGDLVIITDQEEAVPLGDFEIPPTS